MVVDVEHEERYWYPDDGGIVWLAGFMPIDPDTRSFLRREALRERGLLTCGVASDSCWCAVEDVPPALLAELRERYMRGLCPSCLAAAVRGVRLS